MSRIIYPVAIPDLITLLEAVISKNNDEPDTLKNFLLQKEINLQADLINLQGAAASGNDQRLLTVQSENSTQLRNRKFNTVFTHVKGMVQFLKSLVNPNFRELGEWGIPVIAGGKINYPPNVADRMDIFDKIKTKHDSYPAGESPLLVYLAKQEISLDADAALVAEARQLNKNSKTFAIDSETRTQEKDISAKPAIKNIREVGSFLKILFGSNSRGLGNWGFKVEESPAKARIRTSKLLPGAKITTMGVVLGAPLNNVGAGDIHLYKGKTIAGSPLIINPGGKIIIEKGFSTITIINPDLFLNATFNLIIMR